MTPFAWEHWVERYEARGFTVLTPGYPGIGQGEAGLKELRDNPDAVAGVGVREIMDYLTDYITTLDSAPVIMGHSFGGTFAQLLVGNGLGAAGVSIDGARRFQYQSGLLSDPAFEANTRYRSPSARYITGLIRCCPLRAPTV
jgi:pimeloyl-ACP methyl ester carboxylesterase